MKTKNIVSMCPPLRTSAGHHLRQKDLANVFGVTTRQIRRWERGAEEDGMPIAKPYVQAGLARMFVQRRSHRWSREWAEQLGLLDVFEEFERCLKHQVDPTPPDHRELSCTNLLLHLAGDNLPEGMVLFKLGQATVADAQTMLGQLMSYAPTAKKLSKAWSESISLYMTAIASKEVLLANDKAV